MDKDPNPMPVGARIACGIAGLAWLSYGTWRVVQGEAEWTAAVGGLLIACVIVAVLALRQRSR